LERNLLASIEAHSVEDVVRRLCGVQAQVASSAEMAIRVRQAKSKTGEVAAALAQGRLIKTWAMRGTLHLFTPQDAGLFLALLAGTRAWERPIWERYFGVSPKQIEALRTVVTDILGDRALTREELGAEVTRQRGFEHLGGALKSGWGEILKPLAWQGDICFGPSQGARVTFMRTAAASKAWAGVPSVEDALPKVIRAYLGAYGPATMDNFSAWLSRGAVPKRRLRDQFVALGDDLATVEVDGQPMYVGAEHLDALAAMPAKPRPILRLLPGFDQWVLGPGTDDGHVTPAVRRRDVSRTAGWIAPAVVLGGVVSGTWQLDGGRVAVSWFREAGNVPNRALDAEVKRLSRIVGRDLTASVSLT
jgi:hypothetical protein